jgi:UDP-N-acetylglucosamine--dolichyl-phosphate N-acetylglucosaminephosphotransferase
MMTTFLGFADDVLDIPWRVKFLIPFVTSLPLVLHYSGSTKICWHGILAPLRFFLRSTCVNVGYFYHIDMVALIVFATHAINIYAGINGLEAGQTLVITSFLLFHTLCYWTASEDARAAATILMPFLGSTFALLRYNWYPSRVFVGDTFTLTAGAVIGVAGVLGHFVEMTLLFMFPQIINFVISLPQLVGIVHCPRHRLPKFNKDTGKLEGQTQNWNFINVWLLIFGPKTERRLCVELLLVQVASCLAAYVIKFLYHQAVIP